MSAVTYYDAGARLRKARKEKGLLQWEVAAKAGITAPVLSSAENGRERLSVQAAEAVARVIGLRAADVTAADPPRPVSPLPAASPGALTVRSHRHIPGTFPSRARVTGRCSSSCAVRPGGRWPARGRGARTTGR